MGLETKKKCTPSIDCGTTQSITVKISGAHFVKTITLVIFLLISSPGFASEVSTNSTGDYALDLSQVWGAIKTNERYRDLCNTAFPETKSKNNAAYKEWRSKYLPFIQSIEKKYDLLLLDIAQHDNSSYTKLLTKSHSDLDLAVNEQKNTYLKSCPLYPVLLKIPRMDLENYYREQMEVINSHQASAATKKSHS